jgi:hypothetical protein
MPYKRKTTIKKRAYKKRSVKRVAKISKPLKRAINKLIGKQIETKYDSIAQFSSVYYFNPAANTIGFPFALSPTIAQGTGEGFRIGNLITVTRAVCHFHVYCALSATPVVPQYVRVMIGHEKINANMNPANVSGGFNDLFRYGNTSSLPQNNSLDCMLPVNRDNWVIAYDKQFLMGSSEQVLATNHSGTNKQCQVSIKRSVNMTKHLGKLFYEDTGTSPTNKSFFIWFLPINAQGVSTSPLTLSGLGTATMSEWWYKDA